MSCGIAWSQKFMIESLNRSYVSKEYRTHRSKLLVERDDLIQEIVDESTMTKNRKKFEKLENQLSNNISKNIGIVD